MRIRVKICGITSIEDATASVMAGADALGFVIWGGSKRYLGPPSVKKIVEVLPPFVSTVGVFVNETEKSIMRTVKETSINTVQLHGEEKPSLLKGIKDVKIIKALRIRNEKDLEIIPEYFEAGASAILLDTYVEGEVGGTGKTFNWDLAVKAKRYGQVILAGGLSHENVVEAIKAVNPFAVDASSLLESEVRIKDHAKVNKFLREIRKATEK